MEKATRGHMEWTGTGLRQHFLKQARVMLDWVTRLSLHEGEAFQPRAWVAAARELEAEHFLLATVIEYAPTSTWPAWRQAFGVESCWKEAWETWRGCFDHTPALASRWLDTLLSARPDTPETLEALGGFRVSLTIKGLDRPLTSLEASADTRLAQEGARCDFHSADWSFVVAKGRAWRTPAEMRDTLLGFLRKHPEAAEAWLTSPAVPVVFPPVEVQKTPAKAQLLLKVLGRHGKASVGALRHLVETKVKPLFPQASWDEVLGTEVFSEWGVRFESPADPPVSLKPKRKKKKALVAPAPQQEAPVVLVPTLEDEIDFPRFPSR